MQQVKEPHARLWREKPADRAGLTQQQLFVPFLTQTHKAGTGQGGWGVTFCSSYLGTPGGWAQPARHGEPCAEVSTWCTLTKHPDLPLKGLRALQTSAKMHTLLEEFSSPWDTGCTGTLQGWFLFCFSCLHQTTLFPFLWVHGHLRHSWFVSGL